MEIKAYPKIEFDLSISGERFICGIDEAGRGCLAGPVVAAAVVFDYRDIEPLPVDDSKSLRRAEREILFRAIKRSAVDIALGVAGWRRIDEINIRNAAKYAMEMAFDNLRFKPQVVLVDGNMSLEIEARVLTVVKGDEKSYCVAAASIVAKVVRDRLMQRYHRLYPYYGFEENKGYPTKKHKQAIAILGPSPVHRRSFRGVSKEKG